MIHVTCALIIKNNRILITQNNPYSDHPFRWEFPGGKIKREETPECCIIREIKEELELRIRIIRRMEPVDFDYKIKQIRLIPFLCEIETGEITLNEHISYAWKKLEDLSNVDFSEADMELITRGENISILEEYVGEEMY